MCAASTCRYAPIACATFTTVLCAFATYRLWRRTHTRAAIYIVFDADASISAASKQRSATCRFDVMALLSVIVTAAWGTLNIVTNVVAIAPARALMPCDGECGTCSIDPHCRAWSEAVLANSSLAAICPPARGERGKDSNATFSCVADAAWMLLTCVFTLFWLCCSLFRPAPTMRGVSPGGRRPPGSELHLSGPVSPPPSAPQSSTRAERQRPVVV